jgi:hypothetical protein
MGIPERDSLPPAHPLRQVFEILKKQRAHLPLSVRELATQQDIRDLMPRPEPPEPEEEFEKKKPV